MRWLKPMLFIVLLMVTAVLAASVVHDSRNHRGEASGRLIVSPLETVVEKRGEPALGPSVITLLLRNDGHSNIRITKVATSCGCTIADDLANNALSPGEEVRLGVRVSVPDVGEKISYVDVFSDSTSTPAARAVLFLKGGKPKVPYFMQLPDAIPLAAPQDVCRRVFSIAALESDDSVPWLRGVECDDDHFRATLAEPRSTARPQPGTVLREYDVGIVFSPPLSGRRYGLMRVLGGDSVERLATVHLSGETRLPLRAVPDAIVLRTQDLPATRTIGFVAVDGKAEDLIVEVAPAVSSFVEVGRVEHLPKESLLLARVKVRFTKVPDKLGVYE
ncbi:MAG: DUF1573 domain-containing protein, partial [Pirellulales bacterium]